MRTSILAFLLVGLFARGAGAETGPARLRLPTGSTIFGVVTELVPGEFVTILLPHGEQRTYAWSSIDLVQVHGYAAVGPGAPPPDLRPWSERTAPASIPPPSGDPPKAGPDAEAPSTPTHTAGWALGARGTFASPTGGRAAHGLGFGGEAMLTHWLSPELGVYATYEHLRFQSPSLGPGARTSLFAAGVRISSSGEAAAALFDLATGYRSLSLQGEGWARRGAIPLRIGAGVRFRPSPKNDVDLLVHVAPHLFGYATEPPQCGVACGPTRPGPLGFVGISLGMGLGL